jgi:glucose/arabinose dehydrogenase
MLKTLTLALTAALAGVTCITLNSNDKQQNPAINTSNKIPADTSAVQKNYISYCGGCHGEKMDAFVDRKWKYGNSRENLFKGIKEGYPNGGMPSFTATFNTEEIYALADYILEGIKNRERYDFNTVPKQNLFTSEEQTVKLDTVLTDIGIPWAIAFLPNDEMLVTEKSGKLHHVYSNKTKQLVTGVPAVVNEGQGGLLDVIVHPQFKKNNIIYLSYSKAKDDDPKLATTAILKATLKDNELTNTKIIFEALPYSTTRHHYGCRMVFGTDGLLYFSVGERGNEKQNPQSTANDLGKIHRITDDGGIPVDNPFTQSSTAKKTIYSYGNRNPQGLALNKTTGKIWETEHGPRGGDEVNIIEPGKNYGWPAISYGINYNGKIITDKTAMPGMEQPLLYWIPSIAPSGTAFVEGDKYKGWKGDLLVGSLRFNYLNRCKIKDGKIVSEELLLKNIGRMRDVRMGPDGYIYVAVENPGYVFKLLPVAK